MSCFKDIQLLLKIQNFQFLEENPDFITAIIKAQDITVVFIVFLAFTRAQLQNQKRQWFSCGCKDNCLYANSETRQEQKPRNI